MPNRIVRDGILTSERVNSLSLEAELFYRRVMSIVDDYGRFDGRASIIRAQCYPLRIAEVSEQDVAGWLNEVINANLVLRYECDAKPFIELTDFRQRTRAKASKWPTPDGHMTVMCQTDDGHMTVTRQSHDGHANQSSPQKQAKQENDRHMTVTRRSDDGHMTADVGLDGGGDGDGDEGGGGGEGVDGASKLAPAPAHIPTIDEVIAIADRSGIPPWYARKYFAKKEETQTWHNKHGRLVKWSLEMARWHAEDGKPLSEPSAGNKTPQNAFSGQTAPWRRMQEIDARMAELRRAYCSEVAGGDVVWSSDEGRAEFYALTKKKKAVQKEMIG